MTKILGSVGEVVDYVGESMRLSEQQKELLGTCVKDPEASKMQGHDVVRHAFQEFLRDLNTFGGSAPIVHEKRLKSILDDVSALPLKKGDACPTPEQLHDVETTLRNNQALFDDIAKKLEAAIRASGKTTFTEIYNEAQITHERNKPIIWEQITANPQVSAMLQRVSTILADSINEKDAQAIAWSEIEKLMVNSPIQYINATTPALILLKKVKNALTGAIVRHITQKAQHGDMALLPGGEKVEQPRAWTESMECSLNFLEMEDARYNDMLATALGQAQTADPTRAEPYFRRRETAEGAPHNNFGYVYVTKKQWTQVAPESSSETFMYMGEDYCAVPIGQYYEHRTPDLYTRSIASIAHLAEHYQGTPAGVYYEKLLNYMEFAQQNSDLKGDARTKGYFDAAYEAERAWVAYVKYAESANLPFMHVHPFERYRTVSTKEHELATAILEPKETAVYMEGKKRFTENARAFLEREGIAAKWPEMVNENIRVIESAACVSLGARIGTVNGAMLAESIPEESEGKQDGIITLFDTQFAQGRLRSLYGNVLRAGDVLGGIAERYVDDIQNLDKFMLHYIMSVLAHELNHNMYMGSKTSFQGSGNGLAIALVEEAKATNGLALSFNDPYNLTPEDLAQLREALPLMLPWNIFRLRRVMRAQFTSHLYLREGLTMIDHGLKSGVLEVKGVKVTSGEKIKFEETTPDQGDAVILRYNLGDEQLRAYVARIADFLKQLAAPYHKTQFEGSLPEGTVVPDITNIEAWQAASFLFYQQQIETLTARGDMADVARLERERDAIEKTWTPEMEATIRALIDIVDGKEVAKFENALKKAMEASPVVDHLGSELAARVSEAFKKDLRVKYPQIHNNGEAI